MPEKHRTRSSGVGAFGDRRLRPRVVILDPGDSARVEVLDLPSDADLGASFSHGGTRWRVTGHRSRSGVLIAELADS